MFCPDTTVFGGTNYLIQNIVTDDTETGEGESSEARHMKGKR
jgi:hypothetical protein